VRAETDLVHAHVEHGGLRRRRHLLEEEPELSPARAERDGIDDPHGRKFGARRKSAERIPAAAVA
jgi:hypothetical protein